MRLSLLRALCLLALGLLTYGPVAAQSTATVAPLPPEGVYPDTLRHTLNRIFANLDKAQVPTGFLQEYGWDFLPLDIYNGSLVDSNRVEMTTWRMIYAGLYSARITGTNPLPDPAAVNTTLESYSGTAQPIAIPILHLNYAILKPEAVSNNLLRVQNDQLYDVAGRTQSPYAVRTAIAACPARAYARTGSVSFILRPELFYTNTGKTLSKTEMDFNDGRGLVAVSWNTNLNVNYTTAGVKRLVVKLSYTDGTAVSAQSEFEVTEITAAARYPAFASFVRNVISPVNAHAGGRVSVRFSVNNNTGRIRKPLIVLEGYDVSSIAPELQENYEFEDFIQDLNEPVGYDLNFELDNRDNFDLIFIDYNNGTDDIRRNAELLRDVLVWVNGEKQQAGSTEQNVIMGYSMGGLVARYCLAEMEKERRTAPAAGNDHQTRTLLTLDSPHRGANVPVGFQALLIDARQVGITVPLPGLGWRINFLDLFPIGRQTLALFNAPATQQLLTYRTVPNAFGFAGAVANNTFLDGEYRDMITFPAGSPPPYELVATSAGSECATPVFNPYTELLRAAGNFFFSPMPWTLRSNWKTEVITNALPNTGESRRVSSLKIWIEKRFFGLIKINLVLFNRSFQNPTNLLPIDGAPGGVYPANAFTNGRLPSANANFLPFFQRRLGVTLIDQFTFVPTLSAIDVTTYNNAALFASYTNGANPANPARVANFITQERNAVFVNRPHPTVFTARQARWLMGEIRGTAPAANCSAFCGAGPQITGASIVCVAANTYSVPNITGATYTWTTSNNITISSGQSTNQVTLVSNGSGSGTVSVAIAGACGNANPAKTVNVGGYSASQYPISRPNYTSSIHNGWPSSSAPASATVTLEAPALSNVATNGYQWEVNGSSSYVSTITSGQGTRQINVNLPQAGFGVAVAFLRVKSSCSPNYTPPPSLYYIYESTSSTLTYLMYPNPTSDYVEVMLNDAPEADLSKESAFEVTLYDSFSQPRMSAKSSGAGSQKKAKLITEGLPGGSYILRIVDPKGVVHKHLKIIR